MQITTWGKWKEQYPDSLVLDKGFEGFSSDPYSRYYRSDRAGIIGEKNVDDRLSTKELVLGITGDGSQRAYAYRDLIAETVINDTFEARPVVVVLNALASASVFESTVDGKSLTFDRGDDNLLMSDRETGSNWTKTTGESVSGPLKGKILREVPSITSFWFAWSDFYPDTEVYTP